MLRCGLASFIFLLAAHVISLAYSTPLVRAKRIYPLNVFLLALAGLAVMVSGFASHAPVRLFPLRMLTLVVVTLTATFGTKDMADVEGDRRRGIRTLFTLLGLGKGRWVNAGLVIVSYLLTPRILSPGDISYEALYTVADSPSNPSGTFHVKHRCHLFRKHTFTLPQDCPLAT